MLDERDLQAIAAMLAPISTRLDKLEEGQAAMTTRLDKLERKMDKMQEDIDQLKEASAITRGALNHLIEWSDKVSEAADFPLPKA